MAALRFTQYSSVTRLVMLRSFSFGISASAVWALLPLLAHRNPDGDAAVYGYMLGALGAGAIGGSLLVNRGRLLIGTSRLISLAGLTFGLVMLLLGTLDSLWAIFPALLVGLTFGLVLWACRRAGASDRQAALLTLAAFAISMGALALRPQLFGMLLFAAFVALVGERHRTPVALWVLVPLSALWANLHGSFFLAPAVLGIACLTDVHDKDPRASRTLLAAWARRSGAPTWRCGAPRAVSCALGCAERAPSRKPGHRDPGTGRGDRARPGPRRRLSRGRTEALSWRSRAKSA